MYIFDSNNESTISNFLAVMNGYDDTAIDLCAGIDSNADYSVYSVTELQAGIYA